LNIVQAMDHREVFRPLFRDVETWRSWKVFLSGLEGIGLEGKEDEELFHKCTGLDSVPKLRAREAYVIAGRRSGKSFISALIAVYLGCFKDWGSYLAPGERGWIFIIANDRPQAKIVKGYISAILSEVKQLRSLVVKDMVEEIELKNQVSIGIKTCNFRTVRGYTLLAAVCEELAFWRSEESANPDKEVLAAVRPSLATIPESLLIGISTPYARKGVLYENWKRHYGEEEGPLIWKAATKIMNPLIDEKVIKQAYEDDAQAAAAEWDAEWRTDIEDFISEELIDAAVIPSRFEVPRQKEINYFGYIDPSGGRHDSMTLAIAHKEKSNGKEGKVIHDCSREARSPFTPSIVIEDFSSVLKSYGIKRISSDRYAGEFVSEGFRSNGIAVKNSELTASEIYGVFLPMLTNSQVELLDIKRLRVQLQNLERRTRTGGKDLITHPPGALDDVANAAAGACVLAKKKKRKGRVFGGGRSTMPDVDITEKFRSGLFKD